MDIDTIGNKPTLAFGLPPRGVSVLEPLLMREGSGASHLMASSDRAAANSATGRIKAAAFEPRLLRYVMLAAARAEFPAAKPPDEYQRTCIATMSGTSTRHNCAPGS
jgi:hypothetical protein